MEVIPNKTRIQEGLDVTQSVENLTNGFEDAHDSPHIMRRETPMSKVAKNLYLDPAALDHAERYATMHKTNLSQLVSDFLSSLPLKGSSRTDYLPALQRLIGSAIPRDSDTPPATIEDYRQHLMDKYGRD